MAIARPQQKHRGVVPRHPVAGSVMATIPLSLLLAAVYYAESGHAGWLSLTLVALAPGMATSLPARLYADEAPAVDLYAPSGTTAAPSGSPVADDFSDLFDAPASNGRPPYQDELDDLFPPDAGEARQE